MTYLFLIAALLVGQSTLPIRSPDEEIHYAEEKRVQAIVKPVPPKPDRLTEIERRLAEVERKIDALIRALDRITLRDK